MGGLKLVLRIQPHPKVLKWYKSFSWLFGSYHNFQSERDSVSKRAALGEIIHKCRNPRSFELPKSLS